MRETVICFRTSENLRKALEKISEMDRRSLSSVVENILYDHVKQREPKPADKEKRRFPRITISAPALVSSPDGAVHAGVVNNISLGGINVSVPNSFPHELPLDSSISVVFTLRVSEKPFTLQCSLRHVRSNGRINIGASLVDTDFRSYRALQDYLVEMKSTGEAEKDSSPLHTLAPMP